MNRRPLIMGIVNITPDSFSGDGRVDPRAALAHAESLLRDGADCLDIGAYSSRPGAPFVDQNTELSRLLPALSLMRRTLSCPLFVDTARPSVARAALDLGIQGDTALLLLQLIDIDFRLIDVTYLIVRDVIGAQVTEILFLNLVDYISEELYLDFLRLDDGIICRL
jgi:hypothetical protein